MFCLCLCMFEVISLFSCVSAGSWLFAFLRLSLCVIFVMMCLGSSLQLFLILPLGMLCLSACSMMFVIMVFAMCTFVGDSVCEKASSVCSVNFSQFAFL